MWPLDPILLLDLVLCWESSDFYDSVNLPRRVGALEADVELRLLVRLLVKLKSRVVDEVFISLVVLEEDDGRLGIGLLEARRRAVEGHRCDDGLWTRG